MSVISFFNSEMRLEDSADLLASSIYLKVVMSIHIITSSTGIVATACMEWKRRSRKRMAHKSLILLMEMHGFWTFLLCLSTLCNNSANLYRRLTMRQSSDLIIDASTCSIRRGAVILSVYGSVFSQMAMAFERYLASRNLNTYEKSGKRSGLWLNAMHLVATFFVFLSHTLIMGTGSPAAHCTLVTSFDDAFYILLASAVFSCELTTIVTFVRLLLSNTRLRDNKDAGLSLTERFQLNENIRMLKMLLPVIWTHCTFGMVAASLFVILSLTFASPEMYPLIEESINWLHLQGICVPLIYMIRLRQERLHNQHILAVNAAEGPNIAAHHVKIITKGW